MLKILNMAKGWKICAMFLFTITVMFTLLSAAPLDPRVDTNAKDDLKDGQEGNVPEHDQRDSKLSFDLSNMVWNSIDVSGSVTIQEGSVGHKLEIDVNQHSHEHPKHGGHHHQHDMGLKNKEKFPCFTSLEYPNNYPSNSDTKQTLSVEDGQAIEITFDHFDVEDEKTCSNDYLQFFDANSNPVGKKMCGQSLPQKLIIQTSTASALFYSDGSVNKKGYKFCYKPVKLVCAAGEINSASCFCESATGDEKGEMCSANQGCTEDGACYVMCIPGPYILQADCFCKEKTNGRGEICTEGLKCGEGGCLKEEAKETCSFDDDLLEPSVLDDGKLSPHDTSELFKWTNNVVPYYYRDESLIRVEDKDLVQSVMKGIEEKTCFKFEEKKKEEYEDKRVHSLEIVIKDVSCSNGCAGEVMTVPYSKKLQLHLSAHITDDNGDDCGYRGLLIHELMHALGVGHTQTRSDRDNFITVKFENIDKDMKSQYKKCENCTLYDKIPYDCGSIMHYGTHFKGKEVIVPKENCELDRFPLMFYVWDAPEKDYELLNIIGNCAVSSNPFTAQCLPAANTYHGDCSAFIWGCTDESVPWFREVCATTCEYCP